MKYLSISLICFALLVVCSCKKSGELTTTTTNDPNAVIIITLPIATTNLNNDLILKLVNDKRTSGCNCGVDVMPPVALLTWNNALSIAASRHSEDMNSNNFFTHNSSNGATLNDRINLTGYKWLAIGENIANGTFTEQAVFDAWITSSAHCKNIMNANFKEMGAAKVGNYWTQDFGKAL